MEFQFGKHVASVAMAFLIWWLGDHLGMEPRAFDGWLLYFICYLIISGFWERRGWY